MKIKDALAVPCECVSEKEREGVRIVRTKSNQKVNPSVFLFKIDMCIQCKLYYEKYFDVSKIPKEETKSKTENTKKDIIYNKSERPENPTIQKSHISEKTHTQNKRENISTKTSREIKNERERPL